LNSRNCGILLEDGIILAGAFEKQHKYTVKI
jgi:hypothetical protein